MADIPPAPRAGWMLLLKEPKAAVDPGGLFFFRARNVRKSEGLAARKKKTFIEVR